MTLKRYLLFNYHFKKSNKTVKLDFARLNTKLNSTLNYNFTNFLSLMLLLFKINQFLRSNKSVPLAKHGKGASSWRAVSTDEELNGQSTTCASCFKYCYKNHSSALTANCTACEIWMIYTFLWKFPYRQTWALLCSGVTYGHFRSHTKPDNRSC